MNDKVTAGRVFSSYSVRENNPPIIAQLQEQLGILINVLFRPFFEKLHLAEGGFFFQIDIYLLV
jgi:xanthosine utilization system XapX-like protein